MKREELRQVHMALPERLVAAVDAYIVRGFYATRTEFFSDAVRRRLEELKSGKRGTEPETPARRSLRQPARSNHEVIANER